jgi:hypothetical protein
MLGVTPVSFADGVTRTHSTGPAAGSVTYDVAELPHAASCLSTIAFGSMTVVVVAGNRTVTVTSANAITAVSTQSSDSDQRLLRGESLSISDGSVSCMDVKCVVSPEGGRSFLAFGAVGTTSGAITVFSVFLNSRQQPALEALFVSHGHSFRTGSGTSGLPVDSICVGVDQCCHLEFIAATSGNAIGMYDGRSIEDLHYLNSIRANLSTGGGDRSRESVVSELLSKVGALVFKRSVLGQEAVKVLAPTTDYSAFHSTCAALVVTSDAKVLPISRSESTLSSATALLQRAMPFELTAALRSGLADRHTPQSLLKRTVFSYELGALLAQRAPFNHQRSGSQQQDSAAVVAVSDAALAFEIGDRGLNVCSLLVAGSSPSSREINPDEDENSSTFRGTFRQVLVAGQDLDVTERNGVQFTEVILLDRRRGFSLVRVLGGTTTTVALFVSAADIFVRISLRDDSAPLKHVASFPTCVNDIAVVSYVNKMLTIVAACGRSTFLVRATL